MILAILVSLVQVTFFFLANNKDGVNIIKQFIYYYLLVVFFYGENEN